MAMDFDPSKDTAGRPSGEAMGRLMGGARLKGGQIPYEGSCLKFYLGEIHPGEGRFTEEADDRLAGPRAGDRGQSDVFIL
jgi:hypothetical protein